MKNVEAESKGLGAGNTRKTDVKQTESTTKDYAIKDVFSLSRQPMKQQLSGCIDTTVDMKRHWYWVKIKLGDTNSTKSKVVDISTCSKKNKVKIDQRSGVKITAVKPQKKSWKANLYLSIARKLKKTS